MMVLRDLVRRPLRTALSALGIGGALALVVLGRSGADAMDSYLEGTLRREQRQDLTVTFARPISPRALRELRQMPGVLAAEGVRTVAVRLQHGHLRRDTALIALPEPATLRRPVERGGPPIPVPPDGVVLTSKLGEVLDLRRGERLEIQLREGARPTVRPVVIGFVDESVGMQVYARDALVAGLTGDQGAISSALLSIDPPARQAVEARLRRSPVVIDVSDLRDDIQKLRDTVGGMMSVWTAVSILLAAAVILGVVYNNARITLTARSRELGTLRVLGFSRAEISRILLGGLAAEVALAVPLGLGLGGVWSRLFMGATDQEMFRWVVVVAPRTYLLAATVTVLAAAASALWVRRSLDRLDLVSVLKTRT
jgi:putative ABC transport system permease protein